VLQLVTLEKYAQSGLHVLVVSFSPPVVVVVVVIVLQLSVTAVLHAFWIWGIVFFV
jgi:hypothetical protein